MPESSRKPSRKPRDTQSSLPFRVPRPFPDESSLWFVAALFGAAYAFLATFDLLCEGKRLGRSDDRLRLGFRV